MKNTWKCGELRRYSSPSAGGEKNYSSSRQYQVCIIFAAEADDLNAKVRRAWSEGEGRHIKKQKNLSRNKIEGTYVVWRGQEGARWDPGSELLLGGSARVVRGY